MATYAQEVSGSGDCYSSFAQLLILRRRSLGSSGKLDEISIDSEATCSHSDEEFGDAMYDLMTNPTSDTNQK